MSLQVKAVAELTGMSIRALHHYDAIGLLKPEALSEAGYRLYSQANLEQLQQILFLKEIGFALKDVKALLSHPAFDRQVALRSHKALLLEKKHRLETMIQTVDKTLEALVSYRPLTENELFEGFDMQKIKAQQKKYAAEVKERWGDTDAYKASQQKTVRYIPADWERIQAHQNQIYQTILAHRDQGVDAPEVQTAVAAYRQSISDNFYTCTPEIFRGLGQMYIQDERFKAFYEKIQPGLAKFLSEAIRIYCDGLGQS